MRWLALGGFDVAARAAQDGRPARWLDIIGYFRADLPVVLLLVPGLICSVAALVPERRRSLVAGATASLMLLPAYVQFRALGETGTYLHLNLLLSAARFALERPDMASAYLPAAALVKGGLLLATTAAAARLAGHVAAAPDGFRRARLAGAATIAAACAAALLAQVDRRPATSFHRAILTEALAGYVRHPVARGADLAHLPPDSIVARYRAAMQAPESASDPAWFGRAAGADLVVIVLETVPARCLDLTGPLDDLPALAALRREAVVGARHFTTYPYSSLANFSLLSGWYPPEFSRDFARRRAGGQLDGMLRPLRALGYVTTLYEPYEAQFENDSELYRLLGVERHVAHGRFGGDRAGIAGRDSQAVRAALRDIGGWIAADRRYAAILLPQTSHGPWVDPVPGRTGADLLTRCRALVAVQDGWLGELLALLREGGRLDSTVVVVTADHGVRNRSEDPAFAPGVIDAYSFQVPVMVAAPGRLDSTYVVESRSSVIDVRPTVLDLLGVRRDRRNEAGAPLWDASLRSRSVCLMAAAYFGATGCFVGDRFWAYNHVTYGACAAPTIPCGPAHQLPPGSPVSDSVRTFVERFEGLARTWLEALAPPGP